MKIEGERTARFRIFRSNSKNELLDLEFETNDARDLNRFPRRLDRLYGYMVDGRHVKHAEFIELANLDRNSEGKKR